MKVRAAHEGTCVSAYLDKCASVYSHSWFLALLEHSLSP